MAQVGTHGDSRGRAGGPIGSTVENRAAPRNDAQIPIVFYGSEVDGVGELREATTAGALVSNTSAVVSEGQKLTIELGLPSNLPSFCVAAEVAVKNEEGFSVRFLFNTPAEGMRMLGLLDLVASQGGAPAAQDAPVERRSAPRLSPGDHPTVAGRVHFACAGQKGYGNIHDISLTGAHVSEASALPEPNEEVEMLFLMGANPRRVRALARVVRRTESGFAVRFIHIQRELEELILSATPKPDSR